MEGFVRTNRSTEHPLYPDGIHARSIENTISDLEKETGDMGNRRIGTIYEPTHIT